MAVRGFELSLFDRERARRPYGGDLWRARNEIFARKGYRFSSAKGMAFARSLGSYYSGVEGDQDRVLNSMNQYEKANVDLIKSIESGR